MTDSEHKMSQETQKLKAEVCRLKQMIQGLALLTGLTLVLIFPGVGAAILFGFLVSQQRGLIFTYIWDTLNGRI